MAAGQAAASVRTAAISLETFQRIARALVAAASSFVLATTFDPGRTVEENNSDRVRMLVLAKAAASKFVPVTILVRAVRVRAVGASSCDPAIDLVVPATAIVHRDRAKAEAVNSAREIGRIVRTDRTDQARAAAASGGPAIDRIEFPIGTSGATGGMTIATMCGTTGITIGITTGTTSITGSTTTGGITTIGTTRTILVSIIGAGLRGRR
jgi:hypothetical protein